MLTQILERFEAIEECYEFMLAYAAQGLPSDESSPRVREFLQRAVNALHGLAESCRASVGHEAILAVLDRDASDSLAALELVLAQPSISSQLVDNLNASIHLRALLTDLFLIDEILKTQSKAR